MMTLILIVFLITITIFLSLNFLEGYFCMILKETNKLKSQIEPANFTN